MSTPRIENIVRRVLGYFLSEELLNLTRRIVRRNYNKGMDDLDKQLGLTVNIEPNSRAIQFLQGYTFDNVKGMTDDLAVKLRQQLSEAMLNSENPNKIMERIRNIMDVEEKRVRAIAVTESHRAYNEGAYHAAKSSGLKLKKQWYNPSPVAPVCKALNGTVVSIDENFEFEGKEYKVPPAHPNCKSRILYIQVDEDEQ